MTRSARSRNGQLRLKETKGAYLMQTAFPRHSRLILSVTLLALILVLAACGGSTGSPSTNAGTPSNGPITVHLGYFPNLTHAVALVGVAKRTFKQAFGSKVTLKIQTFTSSP